MKLQRQVTAKKQVLLGKWHRFGKEQAERSKEVKHKNNEVEIIASIRLLSWPGEELICALQIKHLLHCSM